MTLSRREFVATASFSLVSAASGSFAWRDGKMDRAEKYSNWDAVRAEFDLAPGWLHFSQFYLVSHPRAVRESIERYRRMLDANPFLTVEHGMGSRPPAPKPAELPFGSPSFSVPFLKIKGLARNLVGPRCTIMWLRMREVPVIFTTAKKSPTRPIE
jgi:hypothetical protein